ncbi:MAG: hypothetical protein AVDCRST_MAG90-231 [uncultured Microvirga sp.]|uniref:ABC transporter permease n=1 Tax=uncultured Microvirga sp. TaxID=412392 RepID=A0A6J4KJ81_9HYPH|nr:MAG: hypothetical protein AVDCRST_MAG90-231 [uncultured Microvirga sp.]
MTANVQNPPLPSGPTQAAPARKLSWREKRWARRRRRRWVEEVTGWLLVPVIVLGAYWIVNTILEGLGTSLPAIVQGVQTIISSQL